MIDTCVGSGKYKEFYQNLGLIPTFGDCMVKSNIIHLSQKEKNSLGNSIGNCLEAINMFINSLP